MNIKAETVLFCAPDDEKAIFEAKDYISKHNITNQDAVIKRQAGFVVVIAKRDFKLGGK